jgi:hypothetical protein
MINFDIIILNKMNNSELKLYILNKIEEINDNSFILEKDIEILIENCYKINNKLKNTYFDNILYDIELQYKYDEFYLLRNIDKIKLILDSCSF